jgi:trimethylamine--corrinoid protein Co-methyltransferase
MAIPTERNISFSILGKEGLERIHDASIHLMEKVGMRIGGERAQKLLKENGVSVTGEGLAKIPKSLVERALKTAPKELVLYNRAGEPVMTIDSRNGVYFGCHSDMLEIVDPFTGAVRDFTKADIQTMCKIADALPNIHFVLSVGIAKDVRPGIQSQISFLETVKNFSKTINFSTNDIEAVQEVIDMAAVVAGGHENLRKKPFIFNYCEPIPPLSHPAESMEKLLISAENRIPVVYMPYSMMGGTAPVSRAASLAQCNAEVLTGLVVSQLVSEGAPFIYGAMPSIMDMKTSVGSYGAVEFHLMVAAASEVSDYYGLPFYGTAGCTDAKTMDEQAVAEATMEIFSTLLSKANLIHDIGVADHCNSVCPELVVLSDEIIEMLKYYNQGVTVNAEELVLDLIEKVGPGGAYLSEDHTVSNLRKVFYPALFSRKMKNPDQSEVRGRIRSKIKKIVESHAAPQLDETVLKELDKWQAKLESR